MRRPPGPIFASLALVVALGATAHARPVEKERWRDGRWELGPRISHLQLTDAETEQVLPMGGVGGYVRYRFTRRLGIEGALDLMMSDELGGAGREGEVTRFTAPITASALLYLFPDSKFQLYFLAGLGVAGHTVEYEALGESINFATPLLQLGIGGQYRTRSARLDFSIRSLSMARNGDDIESRSLDDLSGVRPVEYEPLLGDRTLHGGMLTFGIHWGL